MKDVLEQALNLPPVERAELIEQLLESFELPSTEEIDILWAKEVEDRIDAYNQGKIEAISARKIFDKIDK